MRVKNVSNKIIGIHGEPLLPDEVATLKEGEEKNPSIQAYVETGLLKLSKKDAEEKKEDETPVEPEPEKVEEPTESEPTEEVEPEKADTKKKTSKK